MKYDPLTTIVRAIEMGKSFNKPEKPKRTKKPELDLENLDLAEVFIKISAKEERLKKAKEQIEKMMKKDEKKDDKKDAKGMNFAQVAMFMLLTSPITGPMMLVYWKWAFDTIKG